MTMTPTQRPSSAGRKRSRRRGGGRLVGWAALLVVVLAVAAVVASARSSTSGSKVGKGEEAQPFVLPRTDGSFVTLADVDGPALLYFNEGVGCDICFEQLAQLERSGVFDDIGVTVLPVVVQDAQSVGQQLERFGIETPYVLDPTKEISDAYDTLGRGHHADLPGHSFILVDDGKIIWRGDYPSMWVDPGELAGEVKAAVA